MVTKAPAIPNAAHQATGRQRGVSSRPSGNSSRRNVIGTSTSGIQPRLAYAAPAFASPSEAGWPSSQYEA